MLSKYPKKNLLKIFEICKKSGKPFRMLPSVNDIISGGLGLDGIKEVSILDLIDKNEVSLDENLISEYIHGKRIFNYWSWWYDRIRIG